MEENEQLQKILDALNQIGSIKDVVDELKKLQQEVQILRQQNEMFQYHLRELYKSESLEDLLPKMSNIGKDAIKADDCNVYVVGGKDSEGNGEYKPYINESDNKHKKEIDDIVRQVLDNGQSAFADSPNGAKHIMAVPLENQDGDIIGVVVAERDARKEAFKSEDAKIFDLNSGQLGATFRSSLEQKIAEYNAVTDKLTQLNNRAGMMHYVKDKVLSRLMDNKPVSAIMFDIDHFKRFNDDFGHDVGDKCLKQVADLIKNNVRVSDSGVFRWGGEEMVVVLPVGEAMAFDIAERIRHTIEATPLVVDDKTTTQITVSGGIAEITAKSIELDKNRINKAFDRSLKEADENLYSAKEDGRNRVYGSETLMRDHYSLPSPTELYQNWCYEHQIQPEVVADNGVPNDGRSLLQVMESREFNDDLKLLAQDICTDDAKNRIMSDDYSVEDKAIMLLEQWENNKYNIPKEAYMRDFALIQEINAIVYKGDEIIISPADDVKAMDKQVTAEKPKKTQIERD